MKHDKRKTNKNKSLIKNDFDFKSLLKPYASEDEIKLFDSNLNKKPLSSFILNKKYLNAQIVNEEYDFLISNNADDLVYQFDSEHKLGKSILNFAGGFYLMDISSSLISYYLKDYIKENGLVLDMCSAPGGKTISLAIRRDDLLIVSNDISYKRQLETIKNYSRLGLNNICSTSIDPLNFENGEIYDLVILDAPCSGSGMIRKDEDVKNDFSLEKVKRLLPVQSSLLNKADNLLKKGGYLLYSTCSLSIEEDELQIKQFLSEHNYEIVDLQINDKTIISGVNKLGYHLVPGIYKGEGIYFVLLKKQGDDTSLNYEVKYEDTFENLNLIRYKNNVYAISKLYKSIANYNFITPGIKLYNEDEFQKCKYDSYSCKVNFNLNKINLSKDEAILYASGSELKTVLPNDNLVILTYKNIPLGYGKVVDHKIKNYLPKYLKTNLIL